MDLAGFPVIVDVYDDVRLQTEKRNLDGEDHPRSGPPSRFGIESLETVRCAQAALINGWEIVPDNKRV